MNHSTRLMSEVLLVGLLISSVLLIETGVLDNITRSEPCIASSNITRIVYDGAYMNGLNDATLYLSNGLYVTTNRAKLHAVGDLICTKRGELVYEN